MSHAPALAVIVGIDGSRAAVNAALWAVKEAVSRDIPLRLLCAIDPADNGADAHDAARALANAEIAIRQAFIAVEATEQPVKIELEVVQDRPIPALLAASRSAALVCVGAIGLKHASYGRIGSTAAAVAESAHCPIAVVRTPPRRSLGRAGGILVEVDAGTSSAAVLQSGVDEALLRDAPLRVMCTWQCRCTDVHDVEACADRNRLAQAELDRRLSRWRRRYPELDVEAVTSHGNTLDYLAAHRESVQLVVVGADCGGTGEIVGSPGIAVVQDSDCTVLTCDRRQ